MSDAAKPVGAGAHFVQRDLFGGRGAVDIWNLLGNPAGAAPFTAVLRCALEPAGTVGRHRQEHDPEIVLCLAGTGEARVDGAARPLQSGALVHLPLGSVLELVNLSDAVPLDYLIIKASAPSKGGPSDA